MAELESDGNWSLSDDDDGNWTITASGSWSGPALPSNCTNASNSVARLTGPAYQMIAYAFPVIFTVGVLGNVLNLIVLNSKGMRTKTNALLSVMAVADLCFFVSMMLINLPHYGVLAQLPSFLRVYYEAQTSLITFANCFSMASTWIAVTVSVERLVAIRRPLHARLFWRARTIAVIVTCIFVVSFAMSIFNWFWRWPVSMPHCDSTDVIVYGAQQLKRNDSPILYDYVQISRYLFGVFSVVVPVVSMTTLNSFLVHSLRRNRRDINAKLAPADLASATCSASVSASAAGGPKRKKSNTGTSTAASAASSRQRSQEMKATVMVMMATFSFICFLTPSAVVLLVENFFKLLPTANHPAWYSVLTFVSNQLVTINRAVNFIVYCSAGQHFRRQLLRLICGRLGVKQYYLSQATGLHWRHHPHSDVGSDAFKVGVADRHFPVAVRTSSGVVRTALNGRNSGGSGVGVGVGVVARLNRLNNVRHSNEPFASDEVSLGSVSASPCIARKRQSASVDGVAGKTVSNKELELLMGSHQPEH